MHISPGGHEVIIHGSVDTLLLLLSKPNFGRSVVLDRVVVDVLVLLSYFIPGFVVVMLAYSVVSETR